MKYACITSILILIVVFVLALSTATNAFIAAPAKDIEKADYMPGQIMIRLESNSMSFSEIESVFKQVDKRLINIEDHYKINSEKVNKKGISRELYILEFPKHLNMEKIAEKYKKLPYVRIAEPVYIGYAAMVPNDSNFTLQWGLHNTGQAFGTPDADIDAPEAYDIEMGDSSIIIAVIDSGVDFSHPDLDSKLLTGFNFLVPRNLPEDDYGHGTSVTGIIAAETDNNEGIASVCPNCMILPLKAINNDGIIYPWDAADAILYAAGDPEYLYLNPTPAKVISMSFKFDDDSQDIRYAVQYAYYNFGVTLVAAAGNQNGITPRYPAAYPEVISVGATNRYDERWTSPTYGSNYGDWVDMAAPGMEIWTTNLGTPDYVSTAGTSISTPFVSGIAGLLLSYDPTLTNTQIAEILNKTGDPTTGFTPVIKRVNAFHALTYAAGVDVQLGNVYYNRVIQLGQQTTLFFTVKNVGPIGLTNVQYKIDAGSPGIAFNGDQTFVPSGGIMTYTIPSMNPGETVGVYITWQYQSAGTFNFSVDVDSNAQYFEINETNNHKAYQITVNEQS